MIRLTRSVFLVPKKVFLASKAAEHELSVENEQTMFNTDSHMSTKHQLTEKYINLSDEE